MRYRNGRQALHRLIGRVLDARAGDASSERALADHLHRNPQDRATADELGRLWDDIGRVPAPELRLQPADAAPSLIRRVPVTVRWAVPVALAAGVAAVIVSTVLPRQVGVSTPQPLHYVSTASARTLQLADGSSVTLAPRSALDVALSEGRRDLKLAQGEAFFQVAHDTARPFVVATAHGQTQAVGTAFNVFLDGNRTTVTVAEGRIRVSGAGGGASRYASAGQQIGYSVDPGGVATVIGEPIGTQDRNALGWRTGMLTFEGTTLAQVVSRLNRYSPRQVVIADPSIGSLPIFATIRTDRPDGLLAIVAAQAKLDPTKLRRALRVADI